MYLGLEGCTPWEQVGWNELEDGLTCRWG